MAGVRTERALGEEAGQAEVRVKGLIRRYYKIEGAMKLKHKESVKGKKQTKQRK